MAIIKKTITGLKPGTNYLFSLKPKNTEISAVDPIPDTIRVQTPGVASTPSSITGVVLAANYKSAMLRFNHAPIVDLDYYEYKIYLADDLTETALKARASTIDGYMVSGMTKSNLVVISDLDNTTLIGTNQTNVAYKAKVRAVNTGGNAGSWSSASNSSTTELIESQFVKDLTAAKITAGTIGAQEIILTNSAAPSSYTPPSGTAVLRSSDYVAGSTGWIIRGDGTAEFGSASIRGVLAAKSIYLDAYNRWGRNSTNTADETNVFVVGKDANSQIYWDGNTLTVKGSLVTGNTVTGGTVGGVSIGSSSIYITDSGTTAAYESASTGFYVDSTGRFSLRDKLKWNGSALTIDGSVTIGSNTASSLITGTQVNSNVTSISGGVITTGTINLNNVSINNATSGNRITLDSTGLKAYSGSTNTVAINSDGTASFSGTITGSGIITSNNLFKVDASGNTFANNIYATGGTNETGLQVRADGGVDGVTGTAGSLWLLSSVGTTSTTSSQYGIRIGSTNRYLTINYPIDTGNRQHISIETGGTSQHLRLNSGTGKMSLMGNTQNWSNGTNDTVFVNGDIVLTNYGSAANTGASRTVFSSNIGTSTSGTTIREGTLDSFNYYGSPSSLRSLKENISDINNIDAVSMIKKLRPRQFTWKPNEQDTDLQVALKSLDLHYGFIAEEIQETVPQLSTYKMTAEFQEAWPNITEDMLNDFPLSFYKDAELPPLIISAVQNLILRIEYLESQLAI